MNDVNLTIETPERIADEAMRSFIAVATKADEVDRVDVECGSSRAKYLLWIGEPAELYAVAVLKQPNDGYKARVFQKAKAARKENSYRYEFGYAYTEINHRRLGYGERLLKEAIRLAAGDRVYATARVDNDGIHRLLTRAGFQRSGGDYPSERTPEIMLALFVR